MHRSFIALAILSMVLQVAFSNLFAAEDWPSYRRDHSLSGTSPLRGGLATAPREIWSVDLGGALSAVETVHVEDLTGDGEEEVLRIRPT